jgi:hypothetical protein
MQRKKWWRVKMIENESHVEENGAKDVNVNLKSGNGNGN